MQSPNRVNNIPLLGQREQQATTQIQAAIGQLAMQLYAQVAVDHIKAHAGSERFDVEVEELRSTAKDCILAAKCYFEGIGMIEVKEEEKG